MIDHNYPRTQNKDTDYTRIWGFWPTDLCCMGNKSDRGFHFPLKLLRLFSETKDYAYGCLNASDRPTLG